MRIGLIALLLVWKLAQAQISFLEKSQHTITPNSIRVVNGFQWNDSTYFALYEAYFGLGSRKIHIIEYDRFGKLRREITPTYHYGGAIPTKLTKIGKDKFYLTGSGDDTLGRFTSFNYMYDKDWNILWTKGYESRFGELVVLNDSVAITLVNFRNYRQGVGAINYINGDTIWTKSKQYLLGLNDTTPTDLWVEDLIIEKNQVVVLFSNLQFENVLSFIKLDGSFMKNIKLTSDSLVSLVRTQDSDLISIQNVGNYPHESYKLKSMQISSLTVNWMSSHTYQSDTTRTLYKDSQRKGEDDYILDLFANHSRIFGFNSSGNIVSTREYKGGDPNKGIWFESFQILNDGSYFITGQTDYFSSISNSFIMKTDSNGFITNPTLFPLTIDTGLNITVSEIQNTSCEFKVYPNPTSSLLNVEISSIQPQNYTLQNLNGQIVLEGSFENKTQLDVSKLPNGLYFLQLKGEGILETRKIIVSH